MSILLDPPNLTRRCTPGRAALWLALGLMVWMGISAFLIATLLPWVTQPEASAFLKFLFVSEGVASGCRRILLLVFVIVSPFFLKRMGWGGVRDLGWTSAQTRGERKKDALVWSLAGLSTSLVLGGSLVLLGQANWVSFGFLDTVLWILTDVLWSGVVTMIVLESFFRGMFYRTLTDQWTSWASAGVVSVLIAWFGAPSTTLVPFEEGTWAVTRFMLLHPVSTWANLQIFGAALLLGLILCRFVHHKGDIWGAVGLHASIWIGLSLFTLPDGTESLLRPEFYGIALATPGFLFGLLIFWGWIEWRHRKKLTSYGRVHF